MSGRPLRFLGIMAFGWTSWRVVMLWPQSLPPPSLAPPKVLSVVAPRTGRSPHLDATGTASPILWPGIRSGSFRPAAPRQPRGHPTDSPLIASGMMVPVTLAPVEAPGGRQSTPPPGVPAIASPSGRWSGSAWMVLRGGGTPFPGLTSGRLGGSQAGLRIAYALDQAYRIALVSRLTSPIGAHGREAALGLEWRPTRLPVRLVVEQRAMLDRGRGGPAAGVIGGFGPSPLPAGFTLESYAQAGAVRRVRTEPFVDGAIHLARPVTVIGHATFDLGLGLSGGAQRDAARLDVGPSIGLRVPLAGHSARLSLDWRQRIAGAARPGSGLAFTLGGDF